MHPPGFELSHILSDATTIVKAYIRRAPIPADMRDSLLSSCAESFGDVHRWWEKHGEIFQDRKAHRSQHLRLFFDTLVWNPATITVDDLASAKRIIETNSDWPQLQFQFACAYALEPALRSFDKIWMRAFKKKLNDHPLYDFWFAYLHNTEINLFDNGPALTPHQLVSLAFQWAVSFGYIELTKFFWHKVTAAQGEYVAMLQWRHLVRTAKHKEVFGFLCEKLCAVNAVNVTRITTPLFLHSIQNAVDKELSVTAKDSHVHKIKFLLTHGCERLRRGLFEAQNFRALTMCMQRKNTKIARLLQAAVPPQQMMTAVERVGIEFPVRRGGGGGELERQESGQWPAMGSGRVRAQIRQWSMG